MPKKILPLLLFLFSCPFVFAEVVVLKTGEAFEGTIVERTDEYIQIQTGGAPVYLSLDQIQEITDKYPEVAVPAPTTTQGYTQQAVTPSYGQQVQEIPLINGKDGQFYYRQAKLDFQSGNLKESMNNLYYAASLGVEDSEGLKDQITKAVAVAEQVESKKQELKKAVDQLDPAVQTIIVRIAMVLGVVMIGLFLVKILTRERNVVDESPLFKMQREAKAGGKVDGFVKAGANKRVCAYLIDSCVIAVPCLFVQFLAGSMFSTLVWLVYLLIKDCFKGQSFGKKLVGIQIVDLENKPAGPNQVVMRNLFWIVVCILPLFHLYLGLLSAAIVIYEYVALLRDPLGQRFGDKMSMTRVYDLKPHIADWKFIIFSALTVIAWFLIYSAGAFVLANALNRTDMLAMQKDFRDPLNRFSMRIPADFNQAKDVQSDNMFVFDRSDKDQVLSVMVMDKEENSEYTQAEFDMFAISFLALKLKVTAPDIIANTNRSPAMVSGRHAIMFIYETDQGKNVSVCFMQGKRFFEIHFLFKHGEVDKAMVLRSLMNFNILP